MCGIVGYIGKQKIANEVLINGLKSLEYRGYDSAGLAVKIDNQIHILKTSGKVSNLQALIEKEDLRLSHMGIAHTRWATHGIPNDLNSHPHHQGKVTLVHNGIIENYHELKEFLIKKGYHFLSDTDTEVACALIDYLYSIHQDKQLTLQKANEQLIGSFAFAILFEDDDTLYAMRRHSPLILAVSEDAHFIASDVPAILKYTKNYILLKQDQYAMLSENSIHIYNIDGSEADYEVKEATMDLKDIEKGNYPHFMLKEIHEQPVVIKATINHYVDQNIDDLLTHFPDLSSYKQIDIVACGSAMHAGLVAKDQIEKLSRIKVNVEIASEYRYRNPILNHETLVIVISQSGETADSLAALSLAKANNVDTLAIVNVVGSSIAREAKYVAYTYAGAEIAVATTKAYATQVTLLSLFAVAMAYSKNRISFEEANHFIKDIQSLPNHLSKVLNEIDYQHIAQVYKDSDHLFFIGRGIDYALSMEGSLKLKEISYIHSEAYAAGELKHGTISLIEDKTPVIALMSESLLYEKTISNIKEVKARGANVLAILREDFNIADDAYDQCLFIPKVEAIIQPILMMIPLQLLSYHVALIRDCEIDQPRNLAKSVTVE